MPEIVPPAGKKPDFPPGVPEFSTPDRVRTLRSNPGGAARRRLPLRSVLGTVSRGCGRPRPHERDPLTGRYCGAMTRLTVGGTKRSGAIRDAVPKTVPSNLLVHSRPGEDRKEEGKKAGDEPEQGHGRKVVLSGRAAALNHEAADNILDTRGNIA